MMAKSAKYRDVRLERFLQSLADEDFKGDIETGFAAREVLATDNSIYHVRPLAAIFPRELSDLPKAVRALANCKPDGLSLTPRGGGTGTNGQSLNNGVVLDTSRYLTRIKAFDPATETVTVEPGVVLDQLNAFLFSHGYFFPPTVSTASRATLGGMIATDASGKGSRKYGRTSDYIRNMDVVLADGTELTVAAGEDGASMAGMEGEAGRIYRSVLKVLSETRETALRVFPRMNRGLTGYNLLEAFDGGETLNLCKLLSGSEGTLAVTGEVTLKVVRKPRHSGLVVLFYDTYEKAVRHVPKLVEANPLAVEILDDKVMSLAQKDMLWPQVKTLFHGLGDDTKGLNFVEVVGDSSAQVESEMARVLEHLKDDTTATLIRSLTEQSAIKAAWSLRAKAVGLLGGLEGDRKGTPFVEDTAVPPEQLADYILAFRALLDRHGVEYAMFGHADVGCIHVRPALDMSSPSDQKLIRIISDEVAALTKSYGGLLWGEHGRGVRGEYSPLFFGTELYAALRRIKHIFDPQNRLNPGKLAVPEGYESTVSRIDQVTFRGTLDAAIPSDLRKGYAGAVDCNGNGVCHSWDAADPMCPSYKATRDKTKSPNGRAALIRAWLREPSAQTEVALKTSMDSCLSCRACESACPVRVDIPTMKASFLETYYRTRPRPLRDRVVRVMEDAILTARRAPRLANLLLNNRLSRAVTTSLGFVDLPEFATGWSRIAAEFPTATSGVLARLNGETRRNTVILLPDSFLASFDHGPILAAARVLNRAGKHVLIGPVIKNGKALEVVGYLSAYRKTNKTAKAELGKLLDSGLPVIAIEPATFVQAKESGLKNLLALDQYLADMELPKAQKNSEKTKLFTHCTEKTFDPGVATRWLKIFERADVDAVTVDTGCCGMSGLFGHQRENTEMSSHLFNLSWANHMAEGKIAATGFSCRCQTERLTDRVALHPVEILAEAMGLANG